MKNLAPNITRQRLLIEGFYKIYLDKKTIRLYLQKLAKSLNLSVYKEPIIFSPMQGKKINRGYDAFVPLIDSGISLYVWSNIQFLSVTIYSCKNFNERKALEITKKFFKISKIESQSF